MELTVAIAPGIGPMDRGYVEDLLVEHLTGPLGQEPEVLGGGTLLGPDGGAAESDFDLELPDDADLDIVRTVCAEVLGGIPFTLRTTVTVRFGEGIEPLVVVIEPDEEGG